MVNVNHNRAVVKKAVLSLRKINVNIYDILSH